MFIRFEPSRLSNLFRHVLVTLLWEGYLCDRQQFLTDFALAEILTSHVYSGQINLQRIVEKRGRTGKKVWGDTLEGVTPE